MATVAYSVPGYAAMVQSGEDVSAHPILGNVFERVDAVYRDAGALVLGPQQGQPDTRYCVFGALDSSEGPARSAIRASVAARALVKEASAESWRITGSPLALHVGIDSGKALIQLDERDGQVSAVEGVSLVVASRLADTAPAQTILVDASTRDAAGETFSFSKADSAPFQWPTVRVPCFRLELRSRVRSTSRRLLTGRFTRPIVGRERELRQARDTLDKAVAEARLTKIVLSSAPEMGRARFLREAVDGMRTLHGDLVVAEARIPIRTHSSEPKSLLGQLVKSVTNLKPGASTESGRATLREFVASVTTGMPLSPLDEMWLLHLADVAPVPDVIGADSALAAEVSYRAVVELLRMVSSARPLLIVVEDVMSANEREVGIVGRLETDLAGRSVTLVVTTTEPVAEKLAWRSPPDAQIALEALPVMAGRVLIDEILGRRDSMDRDHKDAIIEHAQGVPLVIEETLAVLSDSGLLEADPVTGTWTLRDGKVPEALPKDVAGLVQARIDQMPRSRALTLARAAGCGEVFWPDLLEEVGDPEASANVAELEATGLVKVHPADALEGHVAYRLSHPALATVAYQELPDEDAARFHEKTARWLAVNTGERFNAWLGAIAWHFEAASLPDRAVSYHMQSGEWARSRGDLGQAAFQFDRAQALASDPAIAAEAALALGEVWQLQGYGARAIERLEQALANAVERNDERFELKVLLPLSSASNSQGKLDRARQLIARGLELARRLGAVREGGLLNLERARNEMVALREAEGAKAAEEAAEALTQCGDQLGILRANIEAARTLLHTGQVMRAEFAYDEARRFAEELNHWLMVMRARHGEAWLQLLQGKTDKALDLFATCHAQFERIGATQQAVGSAVGQAFCLVDKSQFTDAANVAAGAFELAESRNIAALAALCQGMVGYIYGCVENQGHRLKAKKLSPAALKAARKNRQQHLAESVEALNQGGAPRLYRVLGYMFQADYLLTKDPGNAEGKAAAERAIELSKGFEDSVLLQRVRSLGA